MLRLTTTIIYIICEKIAIFWILAILVIYKLEIEDVYQQIVRNCAKILKPFKQILKISISVKVNG